jgi:hypothetical protein
VGDESCWLDYQDTVWFLRQGVAVGAGAEDTVAITFSTGGHFDGATGGSRRATSGVPELIATNLRQCEDIGVQNFVLKSSRGKR